MLVLNSDCFICIFKGESWYIYIWC